MGPLVVVIEPMVFCYTTGMSYAHEPVQIQAFIPELAVENLYKDLGRIYSKMGNNEKASECYDKANEYAQKYMR